jgi:hypothetical protein
MKIFACFSLVFMLFGFSSCIEIIDDISLKNDGSGTLKYSINLSSNKVKINSILALDSLEGKKVPTIAEIEAEIISFKNKLDAKTGISQVIVDYNFTDFIFKIQCDFASVSALQTAFKEVIQDVSKEKNMPELNQNWLSWDGTKIIRSIPDITINRVKELKPEDIESLKTGNYTSISRFERIVEKFDNPNATLSKNKMAVMIRTNPFALSQNSKILENTIYLSPIKN